MASDGWVRIPPPTYRQRLLIGGVWFFVVVYVGTNPLGTLGRRVEDAIGGGWITVTATILVGDAAAAALVLLVVTLLTPALDVHVARGLLRLRGRERPFTDLVGALAELAVDTPPSRYDKPRRRPRRDPVSLRLDLAGGGRFRVVLAIGPTTTITRERAEALIAAVRGSRIADHGPDRFVRSRRPLHPPQLPGSTRHPGRDPPHRGPAARPRPAPLTRDRDARHTLRENAASPSSPCGAKPSDR